jgi:hypothetical protein
MYSKTTVKGDKTFINVTAERGAIYPYYRLKNATFILKGLSANWEKDTQYKNIPANFASMQVGWNKSDIAGFIPFVENGVATMVKAEVVEESTDDLPF